MATVDSLLTMERCASCERKLDATWKFCIYCGRPIVAATARHSAVAQRQADAIPIHPPRRRYDGAFWVGVGIAVLGLALIVYAATQIYGSQA